MSPAPSPQPAQHTDACIQDAARYGFCDHTRLFADPRRVRAHDIELLTLHRGREIASWLSLTFLAAATTLLFLFAPLWTVLVSLPLQALGWSGLFAAGLPKAVSGDRSRDLPLDVAERFRLIPPFAPRGRGRRRGPLG